MTARYVAPPSGTITTGRVGNNDTAIPECVHNCWATVQAAIDASLDGDTVYVFQGVYLESLLLINKSISIIGLGRVQLAGDIYVENTVEGPEICLRLTNLLLFPRKRSHSGNWAIHCRGLAVYDSDAEKWIPKNEVFLYSRNCVFVCDHGANPLPVGLVCADGIKQGSKFHFEYCSFFDYGYQYEPGTPTGDGKYTFGLLRDAEPKLVLKDSYAGGRNYVAACHSPMPGNSYSDVPESWFRPWTLPIEVGPFLFSAAPGYVTDAQRSFCGDHTFPRNIPGVQPITPPFSSPRAMVVSTDPLIISPFHKLFDPAVGTGDDERIRFDASSALLTAAEHGGSVGGWNNGFSIVEAPVPVTDEDRFGGCVTDTSAVDSCPHINIEPNVMPPVLDGLWEPFFDQSRQPIPRDSEGRLRTGDDCVDHIVSDPYPFDAQDFKPSEETEETDENTAISSTHAQGLRSAFPSVEGEVTDARYICVRMLV